MNKPFDIAIVILDNGFTSTAIGPMEVFYSAGRLMQLLLGEPERRASVLRMASVDGKARHQRLWISLVPNCALRDVEQADLVLITASHSCLLEQVPCKTLIVPWLRAAYERGSYLAGVCSGVALVAETGGCSMIVALPHTGV